MFIEPSVHFEFGRSDAKRPAFRVAATITCYVGFLILYTSRRYAAFPARIRIGASRIIRLALLAHVLAAISLLVFPVFAQQRKSAPDTASNQPLLKRTTTRRETRRFGYGGKVELFGAPEGSITVEAWPRSEVDITADIEVSAGTEEDLTRLAALNNFALAGDPTRISIVTTGTHDRKFMKRAAKDFPKALLAAPWKIDYRVRVPQSLDLDIYGGKGPLTIAGVEGAIRVNSGQSTAAFLLSGGDVSTTIERGSINVRVASRSWRGRGADIRLASGDLTLELPAGFSGDVDATVLRTGTIENSFSGLGPRNQYGPPADPRQLRARAGSGGAVLSFTVGDGTIRIKQTEKQ